MQKKQERKLKILRTETKKYKGFEYILLLEGYDIKGNEGESKIDGINPNQWWNTEFSKETELLCKNIGKDFMWFDTMEMIDKRMIDKYNSADLYAVKNIDWLYSGYTSFRLKWLLNEIKCFLFVFSRIFLKSIYYKLTDKKNDNKS